jgi:hypothetical protein
MTCLVYAEKCICLAIIGGLDISVARLACCQNDFVESCQFAGAFDKITPKMTSVDHIKRSSAK